MEHLEPLGALTKGMYTRPPFLAVGPFRWDITAYIAILIEFGTRE